MNHLRTILIFLCLASVYSLYASEQETEESGTLIVTYQTDNKGERLNRIRFWLRKDDSPKQILYPKGKAYVNDLNDMSRKVVIDNLPTGNYTIEFLVPNTDRYFRNVSPRKVTISPDDVVKVDQRIKPRQGISERRVKKRETNSSLQPVIAEQGNGKLIVSFDLEGDSIDPKQIQFRLINANGEQTVHPRKGMDTEVPLRKGRIVMIQNLPAGAYKVEFFTPELDYGRTISTQEISVNANKTKSIQQTISTSL